MKSLALFLSLFALMGLFAAAQPPEYRAEEIRSNGAMSSAQLFDLNDHGEAVGGIGRWFRNADGYFEGISTPPCIWDSTNGFVALSSLFNEVVGFYFTPRAINNRGQILAINGNVMAIRSVNDNSDFIRFPNTYNPYGHQPWLNFDATDLADNGDVAITAGQPY